MEHIETHLKFNKNIIYKVIQLFYYSSNQLQLYSYLIYSNDGTYIEYNGPRTAESVEEFVLTNKNEDRRNLNGFLSTFTDLASQVQQCLADF